MRGTWMLRRAAVVLAVMAATLGGPAAASAATSWNVAADWTIGSNPNGAWSYGWSTSRGSTFNLMTSSNELVSPAGVDGWYGGISGVGGPYYPLVKINANSTDWNAGCCLIPADTVVLHPGPGGQNAVVRWTAPADDEYSVAATWTGRDLTGNTSTDDAVLLDGAQLFAGEVTGYLATQSYSDTVSVHAGDTLDFTVGYGTNGNYYFDSTGLAIQIDRVDTTPPAISATLDQTPVNGWTTAPVTVHFDCTDSGSGVDPTSITPDRTITQAGDYAVDGSCSDNAGNSAQTEVELHVTTPDALVVGTPGDFAANATGPAGADIGYEVSANDAPDSSELSLTTSVVLSCSPGTGSASLVPNADGSQTVDWSGTVHVAAGASQLVSCEATDAAGHDVTASFTITVQPWATCGGVVDARDFVVPAGKRCVLLPGSVITHDVKVDHGGELAVFGTSIGHDLHADQAAGLMVCSTSVGHDLHVQQGTGPVAIGDGAGCGPTTVGHDLQVQGNSGPVTIVGATVGHDLQVQDDSGGTIVDGNSAGHDATAKNDDPYEGSGNTAGGTNTTNST